MDKFDKVLDELHTLVDDTFAEIDGVELRETVFNFLLTREIKILNLQEDYEELSVVIADLRQVVDDLTSENAILEERVGESVTTETLDQELYLESLHADFRRIFNKGV